jgi:hypothetical protein
VKLPTWYPGKRKNRAGWTNIDSMLALLVFLILSASLFFFSVDFSRGSLKFFERAQKQVERENTSYEKLFSLFEQAQ